MSSRQQGVLLSRRLLRGCGGAIIEGVCKPLTAMLCYHDRIHYTGVEHVQSLSAMKIMLQPRG